MNLAARRSPHRAILIALAVAPVCCSNEPPPLPPPEQRIVWSAAVSAATVRPSVDSDRVFFGDANHRIVAVNRSTGKTIWTQQNDPAGGPGFQAADGTTVAGPVVAIPDAYVFGLDRITGQPRWQFIPPNTGFFLYTSSDDTTIYAGSGDGRAFAIDATTGTARWSVRVADDTGGVTFNPTVLQGTVYVGYLRKTIPRTGGLGALNAATGAVLWYKEFAQSQPGFSSSCHGNAVFVNDMVIVASDGGEINALDRATGATRWKVPRAVVGNSVDDDRYLVVVGQLVIASSLSGDVIAYEVNTGQRLWTQSRGASITRALAADSSRIFLVDLGGSLVALDAADGKIAWTFGENCYTGCAPGARGPMRSAPLVAGGVVYVGGDRASYALRAHDPN